MTLLIDSAKFKRMRETSFMTQGEFAAAIGMALSNVQRIEYSGRAAVHPSTLRKLAEFQKTPPQTLLAVIGAGK